MKVNKFGIVAFILVFLLIKLFYATTSVNAELVKAAEKAAYVEAGVYKDGGSIGILLFDSNDINYLTIWVPVHKDKEYYQLTKDINNPTEQLHKLNGSTKSFLIELIEQKNSNGNNVYVISSFMETGSFMDIFE